MSTARTCARCLPKCAVVAAAAAAAVRRCDGRATDALGRHCVRALRLQEKWTPLHFAAMEGHAECVSALLAYDMELDEAVLHAALIDAIENGHLDCVEQLLDGGADVDGADGVRSARTAAAARCVPTRRCDRRLLCRRRRGGPRFITQR